MTGKSSAISPSLAWHLEKKYGVDFECGLDAEQRAVAWALEKMMDEHLYFALIHTRWVDDANFDKGPRNFFRKLPAPIRPLLVPMIRRKVRRALHAQGMARHSPEEIVMLGTRSIDAAADFLAAKPFMIGAEPSAVDAAAFAFIAGVLCPMFETELRPAAERHDNLKRYVGRMTARFYPERSEIAGCQAAA